VVHHSTIGSDFCNILDPTKVDRLENECPTSRSTPRYKAAAMSRVTNAILAAHVGRRPDDEIAVVNEFLRTNEVGGGEFREVTDHAGGNKHLECRVYLSAFNHADTHRIVEAVRQAPWRDREMVQLFVKEQEEELFTLRYCGSPKGC